MIEFQCQSCDKKYRVDDKLAGKKARCKVCQAVMQIPATAEVVAAEVIEEPDEAPARPVKRRKKKPVSKKSANISGSSEHFEYELSQRPDFALVTVNLDEGQCIHAETSAMASMSPTVKLKSGLKGGLGKTLGRALGGESMIINTFTASHKCRMKRSTFSIPICEKLQPAFWRR